MILKNSLFAAGLLAMENEHILLKSLLYTMLPAVGGFRQKWSSLISQESK